MDSVGRHFMLPQNSTVLAAIILGTFLGLHVWTSSCRRWMPFTRRCLQETKLLYTIPSSARISLEYSFPLSIAFVVEATISCFDASYNSDQGGREICIIIPRYHKQNFLESPENLGQSDLVSFLLSENSIYNIENNWVIINISWDWMSWVLTEFITGKLDPWATEVEDTFGITEGLVEDFIGVRGTEVFLVTALCCKIHQVLPALLV